MAGAYLCTKNIYISLHSFYTKQQRTCQWPQAVNNTLNAANLQAQKKNK